MDNHLLETLKAEMQRRGYTLLRIEGDGEIVETLVRPDGSLVLTARLQTNGQGPTVIYAEH